MVLGGSWPSQRDLRHHEPPGLRRPANNADDYRVARGWIEGRLQPARLKSTLYFIAALTFASVLGWGVSLSVRTVLLVQGSLTLGAGFLDAVVNEARIFARTVIGGILIVGLSLGCSNVRRSGSRTCSVRS